MPVSPLWIYSLGAFALTLLGAALPILAKPWGKKNVWRLLSLGSGVLLSVAFMEILPEGWARNSLMTGWGSVAAFGSLFALESHALMHSCPEYMEECDIHVMGWVALIALSLHNLLDGFNLAVSFQSGLKVGTTVGLAISPHKFADGLILMSLFLAKGYPGRKAFIWSVLLAAATPMGAWLGACVLPKLSPLLLAACLGFTAGSFLYVGAADILPRIHKMKDETSLFLFLLGLILVGLIAS